MYSKGMEERWEERGVGKERWGEEQKWNRMSREERRRDGERTGERLNGERSKE